MPTSADNRAYLLRPFCLDKRVAVQVHLLLVAFILISMFFRCSKITQKSPAEVVIAVYLAANEGKYSEMEKHLSEAVLSYYKGGWVVLSVDMKTEWDRITKNGTIERIEILKEEIRGEGAEVYFRIYFKDGETKVQKMSLIKEGGKLPNFV